ncbi:50S ribosomal protein L9 [Candidatus Gracilibacteria bacterium]|nr:50S ribosomal protein L9 [Candidatus Gracilibacteria bacterium]
MEVVLNKDVKKLGFRGEVVEVKPGYFRNFLFPNGMADVATVSRKRVADSRKSKMAMRTEQVLENAREVLDKLKGLEVVLKEKVSDKGTLYAAVTEAEVIKAVSAVAKVDLDKSMIQMDHFKDLGDHDVVVTLGKGMEVTIKVVVEAA